MIAKEELETVVNQIGLPMSDEELLNMVEQYGEGSEIGLVQFRLLVKSSFGVEVSTRQNILKNLKSTVMR